MKINDLTLLNMVYDLIAGNPIAGVYKGPSGEQLTHDDLTEYVVEVDSFNRLIRFCEGDRQICLKLEVEFEPTEDIKKHYRGQTNG